MAKPKISDLKKYFATLDEAALREELFKLFNRLPQVQEFYAQELMSESERKIVLEAYKKKIYSQFWTASGNPRNNISNTDLRRLIADFENVSLFPHELVDLILYRVEIATEYADMFGGMSDSNYNAAQNAFEKAVELMAEHKLGGHFKARCEKLFRYENTGSGYIDGLEYIYRKYF
ncbi:MAG: DUF6155 family protein [Bacteroidota bacterium]|uniref:DUF6155 family protein n=1 Tax=Runella sp. TaxID=1960881 RepID=UPI003017B148